MTDLVDGAARELIRDAHRRSLFVEAGAGTGKTTELVARVVNLVATGAALVTEIAAITFTDAAASELRERVRSALGRVAGDDGAVAARRERCAAALDAIDAAPMQTIHAFAQRILQLHPTAVALPPAFEVRDQVQASLWSDERWRLFLQRTYNATEEIDPGIDRVLRTAAALGVRTSHLGALVRSLEAHWHRLVPLAHEGSPASSWSVDVTGLQASLRDIEAMLEHCLDPSDRLAAMVREQLLPWGRRLRTAAAESDFAVLRALVESPSFKVGKVGSKQRWRVGALTELRERVQELATMRASALDPPQQWMLRGVIGVVASFVLEGVGERRSSGVLDFHDLLVLAHEAVRDEQVRRDLREHFRYVFVDEFQDTDPLQVALVDALTGVASGQAPSRTDAREGALFTVGDPKQSIYRFRNADLGQYLEVRGRRPDDVVRLTTNFRTLPVVVDWVNEIFERLLGEELGSAWVGLQAGRSPGHPSAMGGVHLIGDASDDKSAIVRERESIEVVETIRRAKLEGWLVHGEDGEARPLRYGDVAVLLPTRRGLSALERALRRADVPFRVESRSLVWSTQEIRDVLNVLRAVLDPTDAISVVAALRTPFFACGDDDLLLWSTGGRSWDYTLLDGPFPVAEGDGGWLIDDEVQPIDHPGGSGLVASLHHADPLGPVATGLRQLAAWHADRWWQSVSQLVATVLREGSAFALAFARARQREPWNRLQFFLAQVDAWEERSSGGLSEFVRWATVQQEERADAVESIVPEVDDDAVRIMTVHASKGLEFPFVVVAGLGAQNVRTDATRVVWDDDGHLQLRFGSRERDCATPGFAAAAEQDDDREQEEQARLLYVAATRARDHLVVSLHRPVAAKRSLAARLAEVLAPLVPSEVAVAPDAIVRGQPASPSSALHEHAGAEASPVDSAGRPSKPPSPPTGPSTAAAGTSSACAAAVTRTSGPSGDEDVVGRSLEQEVAALRQRRMAIIRAASRPDALSATAIAARVTGDHTLLPVRTAARSADDEDLSMRLAFGSAVHAALEAATTLDAEPSELAKRAAMAWEVDHLADRIERSVRLAMSSDVFVASFSAPRRWKEVTVAALVEDVAIGGSIDLLYERDDGLVIVDYKTEAVEDDGAHARARYRYQLLTYSAAVQLATGRPVASAMLLMIHPDAREARALDVDGIDRAVDEVARCVGAPMPIEPRLPLSAD